MELPAAHMHVLHASITGPAVPFNEEVYKKICIGRSTPGDDVITIGARCPAKSKSKRNVSERLKHEPQ